LENAKIIASMNKLGGATFGFTQFSDMSPREFQTKMTGFKPSQPIVKSEIKVEDEASNPTGSINWVARGKTTPVKNQQQCGSCWAFSATETIESAMLMAGRQPAIGSPQQIVDCDTNDSGCNGGDPAEAMQWIIQVGGQDTESCYPYTAQDGRCASSSCSPANHIRSTIPVTGGELNIYNALAAYGPLSIACDASAWQNYNGGILPASQCGNNVDHAIQLTGYTASSGGYWVVRNSWGTSWGENGFIYLQYGHNTCDIRTEVTGARA
jgi:C1A family cysteine protease